MFNLNFIMIWSKHFFITLTFRKIPTNLYSLHIKCWKEILTFRTITTIHDIFNESYDSYEHLANKVALYTKMLFDRGGGGVG